MARHGQGWPGTARHGQARIPGRGLKSPYSLTLARVFALDTPNRGSADLFPLRGIDFKGGEILDDNSGQDDDDTPAGQQIYDLFFNSSILADILAAVVVVIVTVVVAIVAVSLALHYAFR